MTDKRKWPRLLVVVMLAALVALATGCGGGDDEEQQPGAQEFTAGTTMAKLQQKGEITVGVKFDVPPFGFKNPQTGDVEGFDVDVGKAVADELGVKPKFIEAISDNRIPFLQQGTVDLILSTMTINAERDQEIDFSEPYYVARGSILVPKDSPIKGIDDLAGRRVCTALGSTYEATLREKAPKSERKLVDSYSECFELIQNKAVHAISTDDVILAGMIIQDPNLKLVGGALTTEPYGAGIKEGDTEFQRFVSGVIAKMKSDRRWARLYDKWVGRYTKKQQSPPTITLKEAIEMTT
jgi:ABC-type amino acid transport substrate-binding protein